MLHKVCFANNTHLGQQQVSYIILILQVHCRTLSVNSGGWSGSISWLILSCSPSAWKLEGYIFSVTNLLCITLATPPPPSCYTYSSLNFGLLSNRQQTWIHTQGHVGLRPLMSLCHKWITKVKMHSVQLRELYILCPLQRKCEQYWGENIGDDYETVDKSITITTTSVMPFADFEIRMFNVKKVSDGTSSLGAICVHS